MIDFSLAEEQKACRKLVGDFAQKEIAPIAHELDEEQHHNPEIITKYFEIAMMPLDESRPGIGAAAVGIAKYLLS